MRQTIERIDVHGLSGFWMSVGMPDFLLLLLLAVRPNVNDFRGAYPSV